MRAPNVPPYRCVAVRNHSDDRDHGPRASGRPTLNRLPKGSSPGDQRRRCSSFTIATCSELACPPRELTPLMRVRPIASKKPGLTGRHSGNRGESERCLSPLEHHELIERCRDRAGTRARKGLAPNRYLGCVESRTRSTTDAAASCISCGLDGRSAGSRVVRRTRDRIVAQIVMVDAEE